MNFRFPIFLDLAGKNCLVTGAGYEIAGKVKALVDAGANVKYVHPEAELSIEAMASAGLIRWEARDFQAADLGGCFLVITDRDENAEVFRLAEERNVLCNAVDDPSNCRFSFGSIHRQGDLTIAVSSNGWAPALAVRIRQKLEREIGPEFGQLLELCKSVSAEITERIQDFATRRELWYRIVDSSALAMVREGDIESADAVIRCLLEEAVSSSGRSEISGSTADR